VVLDNSLYVLGGCDTSHLDAVQMLRLDSLSWELMRLKLPRAAFHSPCFRTETQVYLLIEETLYSFSPIVVKPIKALPHGIRCETSYYGKGYLYYSNGCCIKLGCVGVSLTSLK
jgi:hypothetical protein